MGLAAESTSIIRIKVEGKYNSILLDSGASILAIDSEVAERLNLQLQPRRPGTYKRLISATSEPIHVVGQVIVNFNAQNRHFQFQLYVVRNLSTRILLGLDFLRRFRVNCDYGTGQVTMSDQTWQRPICISFTNAHEFAGVARLSNGGVAET